MKTLLIKVLTKVSIFLTNLEKKYLKKYSIECYRSAECDWNVSYCDCEHKNIFRKTTIKIYNIIWELEKSN